jgi:hypothetical protein
VETWKIGNPIVAQNLEALDPLGRGGEVLRYQLLRLEFRVSPHGAMREWLRWNLAAGVSLSIPAIIVVPPMTYLLTQFVTWTDLLVQILKNLLIFPIVGVVFLALLTGVGLFVTRLRR